MMGKNNNTPSKMNGSKTKSITTPAKTANSQSAREKIDDESNDNNSYQKERFRDSDNYEEVTPSPRSKRQELEGNEFDSEDDILQPDEEVEEDVNLALNKTVRSSLALYIKSSLGGSDETFRECKKSPIFYDNFDMYKAAKAGLRDYR